MAEGWVRVKGDICICVLHNVLVISSASSGRQRLMTDKGGFVLAKLGDCALRLNPHRARAIGCVKHVCNGKLGLYARLNCSVP